MPGILQTDGLNGSPLLGADPSGAGESLDESLPPVEEFVVVNQEVSIEINFREQSVQGESRITIYLINPDDPPDEVAFDARQCEIDTSQIRVNGKPVRATYRDPYDALDIPPSWDLSPSNFPVLKSRMRNLLPRRRRDLPVEKREQVGCSPADRSLRIALRPEPPKPPADSAITPAASTAQQPQQLGRLKLRLSNVGLQGNGEASTGVAAGAAASEPKTNGDADTSDQPTDGLFEIVIPFHTRHIRDGLHFVGVDDSDTRFPHVYTRHSPEPGIAACIFPCLDDPGSRCFWKIHIKTPRTLGDALMQTLESHQSLNDAAAGAANQGKAVSKNGTEQPQAQSSGGQRQLQLTEEDKLLDMTVVCSGNLVGEKADDADETKKIMTFEITDHGAAANHIGFAVGPFEHVDLYSAFRTDEDDDKLGASAVKVHGYCLPGRQMEVQNTCVSLTNAADEFAMTYGRYPFDSFKLCFVDDMIADTTPLLSFSLCSTRLLFPDSIVERDIEVTRKLVHSLAYQYFGAYIVPNQRTEMWLTVGIAYYMTDLFMCKLCGNNDYRFRMKNLADKLAEEDRGRPSLHDLGTYTFLGDFEMEFMAMKAPLVLFILDKRLTKAAGSASASLARVISKIIGKANTSGWGDNNNEIISSESFRRVCEKTSQYQLESFWNQWVLGSGCPWLSVKQRFNRKRLCVEIAIHQTQETHAAKPRAIRHADFWRELVEKRHGTYARKVQRLFTGPMTIRIHEANGTPYEHIVEIRDDAALTGGAKFDISYNTKYKRLKRNRRGRERAATVAANDGNAENGDELIVFSLGDKLDTRAEMADWGLIDWTEQDEKNMDQESYEWIRIDSDFEWIFRIHTNMPAWMYLSQLQQDRDIVAQQDTLQYLSRIREHAMSATILTRTLYDDRYFHGLRSMAAENLTRQVWKASDAQSSGAGNELEREDAAAAGRNDGGGHTDGIVYRGLDQLMHVFRHFHCYEDATSKPNDFMDMRRYWVQCAIIDAISKVHYEDKRPREAQRFLLDLLRFNNNSQNLFSDHLYVAKLLVALATSFCSMAAHGSGGAAAGGTANKHGGRGRNGNAKMDMALTFDDGMSDDDDNDGSDDFDLGADISRMEVDTEDRRLLELALAEIERYRRMDEWTSSYQNVWTTAALEAKRKLMRTGVIPVDALEFVRYLQDGTSDTVQIKAFEALIDLGLMLRPAILKLLLATMTTHRSPFVRDQLFKLFTTGLAAIAFGEHSGSSGGSKDKAAAAAITDGASGTHAKNGGRGRGRGDGGDDIGEDSDSDNDTGGLIIEQGDSVTKKHREEHARRESIEAAVAALRMAVQDNKELLSALWEAVRSPIIGNSEKRNLLDLLEVMFAGELALLLTVRHPTMWTVARRAPNSLVLDFKKVLRPLQPKAAPQQSAATAAAGARIEVANPLAILPALAPTAGDGAAAVPVDPTSVRVAAPAVQQRTALPDGPTRKPSMPKIKLQTGRISINVGGSSNSAGATAPGSSAATPFLTRKPSVVMSAAPAVAAATSSPPAPPAPPPPPPAPSVLPSLVKPDHVTDSISVHTIPRKASVARSAASPTPAPLSADAATASRATPGSKRKRQDSHSDADGGAHLPGRVRKLVKIAVPMSYQRKLSPLASHWLETHRTPSVGAASRTSSASGRSSATPSATAVPRAAAAVAESTASATPKPARKPLPGGAGAAAAAPKAPTPAPAPPAAAPVSKPIFIKFKTKSSNA